MALISGFDKLARAVAARSARRWRASPALAGMALAAIGGAVAWYSAGTRPQAAVGGCLLWAGWLLLRVSAPAPAGVGWHVRSLAVEAAVCAALAVSVPAPGREGAWLLAELALTLLAVRVAPEADAAERLLLIAVVTPVGGPRWALVSVAGWGALALAADLIVRARGARRESGAGRGELGLVASRGDGLLARSAGRLLRGQAPPLPPALAGLAATVTLAVVGMSSLTGAAALAPAAVMLLAAPGAGHPHDGRWDWLAPPVLRAGEFAYVAGLGFAAKVPAMLTFALLAVISLRNAKTAEAADAAGPAGPAEGGHGAVGGRAGPAGSPRLGWEGRMLLVGLAAAMGVPMFAYLALTAYLGLPLGWKGLSGWFSARQSLWLVIREGDGK